MNNSQDTILIFTNKKSAADLIDGFDQYSKILGFDKLDEHGFFQIENSNNFTNVILVNDYLKTEVIKDPKNDLNKMITETENLYILSHNRTSTDILKAIKTLRNNPSKHLLMMDGHHLWNDQYYFPIFKVLLSKTDESKSNRIRVIILGDPIIEAKLILLNKLLDRQKIKDATEEDIDKYFSKIYPDSTNDKEEQRRIFINVYKDLNLNVSNALLYNAKLETLRDNWLGH